MPFEPPPKFHYFCSVCFCTTALTYFSKGLAVLGGVVCVLYFFKNFALVEVGQGLGALSTITYMYNYITLCTITRKVQHSEEQLYNILFQ